jgi:signal transduction histidine kinase
VDAAVPATALALEHERLHADLRARLEDLRASRACIVEAGDAERRRLERNLHDGGQQRLVFVLLALRGLAAQLERDPGAAVETARGASAA